MINRVFLRLLLILSTATVVSFATPSDSGSLLLYNKHYRKAYQYYLPKLSDTSLSILDHRIFQDASFKCADSIKEISRSFYAEWQQSNDQDAKVNYLYGRCLPCAEGKAYFARADSLTPCHQWSLNALGACYFESGDLHNAKMFFLRAIKCHPDYGEAYQNLAQVYLQLKQTRRAKKVFRKLIGQNRKNAQAYEWLGDFYLHQKSYRYALMGYKQATTLRGSGPDLYFKLGYSAFMEKLYQEAKRGYTTSISLGNENYEVFFNLGSTYELLDLPEEALHLYQKAYDTNQHYSILYSMGNCAVQLGLYTKAIESYNAFLIHEPQNTEALTGLANAHQLKKEYDKAIAIYNKILSVDATNEKAYYNLGSIYAYYLKDYTKMSHYWEKYIELFPQKRDSKFLKIEMDKIKSY